MQEYVDIMERIRLDTLIELEGMKYGKSGSEKAFKGFATFGVFILFAYMCLHQFLKYMRFLKTKWQPNVSILNLTLQMDSKEVGDGIRVNINLFERELMPSIFVTGFMIGVGAYYWWATFFSLVLLGCGLFLAHAYRETDAKNIMYGRIAVFACTIMLFLILLIDDHTFDDTNLQKVILEHMTHDALERHGASEGDIEQLHEDDMHDHGN